MRIQVKDFMSTSVTMVVGENSIREVRALMKDKKNHAVPVVRYSKKLPGGDVTIRGIVTTSDMNIKIDDETSVAEIMTPVVHVVHKNSSAQAAAKMMMKNKVHHLVVMDDGEIIGMLSSLDFVELVAKHSLD